MRLTIEKTTAVAYTNNMGGNHSSSCNALLREIWFDVLKGIHGLLLLTCQVLAILPPTERHLYFVTKLNGN